MADSAAQATAPAYVYDVKMTCGGCSGAINRVLTKNVEAPNAFSVSLETQKVVVWGPSLPAFDDLTAKIAKTGKEIREKEEVKDNKRLAELVSV
ncbi:putative copper chaperone [Kockovaella imperatae]|uniref:Putative copper chaperone n=1 Tax=Kockovaella imperatae TaxID=4999 RepID=A0A1Y1UIS8_9TREE|nr:putative copper chaperone [Kockovaella imperatae]ORX37941.1 putative copper chaperone [Kockovaella imperatae]